MRLAGSTFRALLTFLAAFAVMTGAEAQDSVPSTDDSGTVGLLDEIWGRDALAGHWNGMRDRWADEGIILAADSIDETLADVSGGVRRAAIYDGRLEVLATLDLDKLIGWTGAALHANAYWTHNHGLSGSALGGNLMTVSNIEATPSIRLFDLWIEQLLLDNKLSIRFGQLAADDEFIGSDTASNFNNASFGWPAIAGADLPSGGPIYDLATPGVRVKYVPSDNYSFSLGVFNGDPAPAGPGVPQRRDGSGLTFRLNGGVLAIGEAAYKSTLDFGDGDMPSTYKLGAWFHSGDFTDERFDDSGQSLASPSSTGIAAVRHRDYGAYFIVDQVIWHEPDTQDAGVSAFLRGAWAPSDRNLVSVYADAGFAIKGLLWNRDNDVFGVAFGIVAISDEVRALDRDIRSFTGRDVPIEDYEATLECTYHVQVNQWWSLQPDLQFVAHPGGHVALPNSTTPIANATVFGLRSSIVF